MENESQDPQVLVDKVERFTKNTIEILKLKSKDKLVSFSSTLILYFIFIITIFFLMLMVNFAMALWLGVYFHHFLFGFLVVGLFYLIVGLIVVVFMSTIKRKVSDFIIQKLS
jgi:hypothetical protein